MSDFRESFSNTLAIIREIRVEVSNFLARVQTLIAARESGEGVDLARERAEECFNTNNIQIKDLIEEMKSMAPACRGSLGESCRKIENEWDNASNEWVKRSDKVANLRTMVSHLNTVALEAAYVTFPSRLNHNLSVIRIGGVLDFHEEFKDELANKDDRNCILDWLDRHPGTVHGIVNVSTGKIRRASPELRIQVLTVFFILLVVGVGCVLPFYAREWLGLSSEIAPALVTMTDMIRAYVLGLVGGCLHVLAHGVKQMRASNAGTQRPPTLGNWWLWLHVRYLAIAFGAVGILMTVLFATHVSGQANWLTLIAVGYSADSILDMLVPKLDDFARSRTELVTTKLT